MDIKLSPKNAVFSHIIDPSHDLSLEPINISFEPKYRDTGEKIKTFTVIQKKTTSDTIELF